jgi:hypothetical protein
MLTPQTLRILNSGCFYIAGRDKFFRPTVVIDGGILAKINKDDPTALEGDLFKEIWFFLYSYMRNVMFIPGQVDTWLLIVDLNNLSLGKLPRK